MEDRMIEMRKNPVTENLIGKVWSLEEARGRLSTQKSGQEGLQPLKWYLQASRLPNAAHLFV